MPKIQSEFSQLDDQQIVELVLNDSQQFRQLVEHFYPVMLIVAKSIVGEAYAEDVVQDSWIAIHKYLPKFEFRSALKTWVCTITANTAKKRLQKETSSPEISASVFESRFSDKGSWAEPPAKWHEDSPEALLSHQQLKDCLSGFMDRLKPLYQAVLSLKEIQNLQNDEICNILDISESNVRVVLHRARLEVFSHIEHYQETGEC